MGKFKPLLSYRGKSFIQNIVEKLITVCDKIIIVTGFNANEVQNNVRQVKVNSNIEFVVHSEYEKGMFTSLQAGLKTAKNSDWILYHFVDQPGLPKQFYIDFIKQIDNEHNWIQPAIKNQKGHPILIHKSLFDLIISSSPESSLREISKNEVVSKKFWNSDNEEILQDFDTKEDLPT
jgi:molybdenum cofactor cytidylyltransferase